ncbi:MAG: HAD-IIB family hydrolase, partial [Gemmatimonadaceae bacterium]
ATDLAAPAFLFSPRMPILPESLNTYQRIVFSDVDGTLLDEQGRVPKAWRQIRSTLADALLVLTSSRTVEELLAIQQLLEIEGPFIAENGAMIVLTNEWLEHAQGTVITVGDRMLRLIPIGTPGTHLNSMVRGAADASGVTIETHRDVCTADLPSATPSRHSVASHALARSHSLLLRLSGTPESRLRFFATLAGAGLTVSHGGRWHVVQGGSSKGIAVRAFLHIVRQRCRDDVCVIGVGDAPNDRSLLEAVDLRFVMRRPDGSIDPSLEKLNDACVAETPGVEGWSDIVHRMHPVTSDRRVSA